MSSASGPTQRSRWILLGSLAGSLTILFVAWWSLTGGQPIDPAAAPQPGTAASATGIQPAPTDSARWDRDGKAGDEPPLVASATPSIPAKQLDADREAWLADPPAPAQPDPAQQAFLAARDAAFNDATVALQAALEDRRGALARTCLKGVDSANIFFEASFDEAGKLIETQVADNGTTTAVKDCVAGQPFKLSIPKTGAAVRVRGTLALP